MRFSLFVFVFSLCDCQFIAVDLKFPIVEASREGFKRGSLGTKSLPPSQPKPAPSATIFRDHHFQTTL